FLGVQYRMKSGCWVLYAKYENFGYTRTHTYMYDENKSRMYTCWTQKGKKFLYELLKKNGYFPLCEQDDTI
ncbi:MAG: phage antirepressor KilAC domain-containing protein, partial [Oscillospiraceae bacterium]|nr:phage antirepressor KilAC domain-containing protein [Oscillospiraceae bacterium]